MPTQSKLQTKHVLTKLSRNLRIDHMTCSLDAGANGNRQGDEQLTEVSEQPLQLSFCIKARYTPNTRPIPNNQSRVGSVNMSVGHLAWPASTPPNIYIHGGLELTMSNQRATLVINKSPPTNHKVNQPICTKRPPTNHKVKRHEHSKLRPE